VLNLWCPRDSVLSSPAAVHICRERGRIVRGGRGNQDRRGCSTPIAVAPPARPLWSATGSVSGPSAAGARRSPRPLPHRQDPTVPARAAPGRPFRQRPKRLQSRRDRRLRWHGRVSSDRSPREWPDRVAVAAAAETETLDDEAITVLQLVHLSDLRDDDEGRCCASGVGAWALTRPPPAPLRHRVDEREPRRGARRSDSSVREQLRDARLQRRNRSLQRRPDTAGLLRKRPSRWRGATHDWSAQAVSHRFDSRAREPDRVLARSGL
jgi:hypothetical protein